MKNADALSHGPWLLSHFLSHVLKISLYPLPLFFYPMDEELQMNVEQTLLDEIVRRILRVSAPDRIILFGSAATGRTAEDSDIDLMILEPASKDLWAIRASIRSALFGLGHAFDLIVLPTERFERTKTVIGTIAWPAAQTGKVIYEAA